MNFVQLLDSLIIDFLSNLDVRVLVFLGTVHGFKAFTECL